MRSLVAWQVLVAGCMCSSLAWADGAVRDRPAAAPDDLEGAQTGFELGLRTGVAPPLGKADAASTSLSDSVSMQIPLWLDAGYRVLPELYVGGYFQYGLGITHNCGLGFDCSASDIRFGANVQWYPTPGRPVAPWFGFGVGYEFFNLSQTGAGTDLNGHFNGWEFANLQLGVDFRASQAFRLGPFVSVSFDQATNESIDGKLGGKTVPDTSASDFDKSIHSWVFIGLRGVFAVGGG